MAADAVKLAMASGLSWDESVAALGVAAKALAVKAATEGDGSQLECIAHANKRFIEGMQQDVEVLTSSRH
jgi:phage-related baseplate assembly protein